MFFFPRCIYIVMSGRKQCQCSTKHGTPCTFNAKLGSDFCGVHAKCKHKIQSPRLENRLYKVLDHLNSIASFGFPNNLHLLVQSHRKRREVTLHPLKSHHLLQSPVPLMWPHPLKSPLLPNNLYLHPLCSVPAPTVACFVHLYPVVTSNRSTKSTNTTS
jgi:hypothetical protein